MRAEAVAPGDVDVLPHDSFEVGRYSSVREKVVGDAGGEIDEQVHVAVGSLLRTRDRTEHCDVDNAALTKVDFVGAELREDVREQRHEKILLPTGLAYNVTDAGPMIEIPSGGDYLMVNRFAPVPSRSELPNLLPRMAFEAI